MPTVPKYKSNPKLFGDEVLRRSIVVSGYLTEAENDAMKAKAAKSGMTQKNYLQHCLKSGIDNAGASNNSQSG